MNHLLLHETISCDLLHPFVVISHDIVSSLSLSLSQLLDVHFTSESLAIALGITQSMGLIRSHLSRKFMELIGPVAAQKKYDAMQSKNFVALDPSETGKVGHRQRSRSTGSRRGRNQEAQENLLCPLDEFPPTFRG